jgi:hypothetical protein
VVIRTWRTRRACTVLLRRTILIALAVSGLAVGSGLAVARTGSETALCGRLNRPLYQVVNPTSNVSLVTSWSSEATSAARFGFTSSPVTLVKTAGSRPAPGLVAVRRLYNGATRDFAWSAADDSTKQLTAAGYREQKVDFFASPTPQACTVPVQQFVKAKTRRLAVGAQADSLLADGWAKEGPPFHAADAAPVPAQPPAGTPLSSAEPALGADNPSTPSDPGTPGTPGTPDPGTPGAAAEPSPTPPAPIPTAPAGPPAGTGTPAPATGGGGSADADGKFSLAVYPDTQMEVMTATDRRLSNRNQYVISQRSVRDIRYVLHVGDVVCWDGASDAYPDNHPQYDHAGREMQSLESAGIPWAVAIGNHDTYAVGPTGGSARPGVVTAQAIRNTKTFNSTFPVSRFDIAGTYEPGKMDNAFRTFTAAGKKWLILNLELWPRADAVAWAQDVVTSHPYHNVIVLTHSYLTESGVIDAGNGGYGSNSGQYVFDHLVKPNPNVKLVLSGHVEGTAVRSDADSAGNKVVSILSDWHSTTTNHVRFVEIDTVHGTLRTDVHAPFTSTDFPADTTTVTGMRWVG